MAAAVVSDVSEVVEGAVEAGEGSKDVEAADAMVKRDSRMSIGYGIQERQYPIVALRVEI